MITLAYIVILVFIPIRIDSASQGNTIERILNEVSKKAGNIRNLSYSCDFHVIEDSTWFSDGKIWIQRIPEDTIFGCKFHLSGYDGHDNFDYYYDGKKCFELWANKKLMFTFDPYLFTRFSKSRRALESFTINAYLLDTNLFHTLIKGANKVYLLNNNSNQNCAIRFVYVDEDSVHSEFKTVEIDTISDSIKKITFEHHAYDVTLQTIEYKIKNIEINQDTNLSFIPFNNDNHYNGYKKEYYTDLNAFRKKDSIAIANQNDIIIGSNAPHFSATTYKSEPFTFDSLKGKIILFDFWEPWCGPCVSSFPKLVNLQKKYSNNAFKIIGISSEQRQSAINLINVNKLPYLNIFVDKKVRDQYSIRGVPGYVLIDKQGRVLDYSSGDLDKIEESIKKIIN